MHYLVFCKASAILVSGAYENERGICGRYSWRVIQVLQEEQKKSNQTG